MLASRQSEVCERNTRVDVRAGCAHFGSWNASPVVPRGIRTSMEWSGLTRIGSSPLRIHIGFVSSHAKQLEHRKRSSGRVRVSAVQQCSDSRSPECTSSIMEPGVANREGKGAIKRAENEKSHSPELWESAWRRPQGDTDSLCVSDLRLYVYIHMPS